MTGDKLTNSYKLFLETRVTVSMSVRGSLSLGWSVECVVSYRAVLVCRAIVGTRQEWSLCSVQTILGHSTSLLSTEC